MTSKEDNERDAKVRNGEARISRNDEDLRRLTGAIEQIRDRFCPPPKTAWGRARGLFVKAVGTVLLYAGGVQAVHWYMNLRMTAFSIRIRIA